MPIVLCFSHVTITISSDSSLWFIVLSCKLWHFSSEPFEAMKKSFAFLFAVLVGGCARVLLAQGSVEPTVTIYATDAHASEAGSDPGTFTVTRTGSTNFTVIVFYNLSGTASNGVDYEQLGGSVQIPAGDLAASFTVKPIDDALVEGDETVVAEIVPSPLDCATCGYTIGTPSNAVVVIADNDTGTNHPPFVRLNSPQDGDVFTAPATIDLRAYAQDAEDGYNLQVEFFQGTNSLGFGTFVPTLCPSPYCPFFALTWSNVPRGDYILTAKATDSQGLSSNSTPVQIYVHDGTSSNLPPTVRMVRPSDGDTFTAPTNIQLVAFAQDPEDKYFVQVEFFEGTNSLGAGTFNGTRCATDCPNYILTWSNVPPGNYVLSAKATDSQGATGQSAPVPISVTGTNLPPSTNVPVVTIVASDPIAVEGPFCPSNWWWTTSWNGSDWNVAPATGDPNSPAWTNNCAGTNTAMFVVRRSGPTNSELTIYYAIGGTASNGLNYVALPGSVTIAAGRRSARIEVVPIDDSIPERIETVVLGLQPDPNPTNGMPAYMTGSPSRAAAIIIDNDLPRPPSVRLPDGMFHLCRPGTNGYSFTVRSSLDLTSWTVLCTNAVTDGAVHYIDPDAANFNTRFYRVVAEPAYPPGE